jgi:hypothetical protein
MPKNDRATMVFGLGVGGLSILIVGLFVVWLGGFRLFSHRAPYGPAPFSETAEQASVSLAAIRSKIETSRSGSDLSQSDLQAISFRVYDIAEGHPEIPAAWTTAALVVDKRSERAPQGSAQVCGESPGTIVRLSDGSPAAFPTYRNCTITLDGYKGPKASEWKGEHRSAAFLVLNNVQVVYRGGAIPGLVILSCTACSFDAQVNRIPPAEGKSLLRGLLFSSFDNFSIELMREDR